MKKWLLAVAGLLLGAASLFGQSATKTLTINVTGASGNCPISCNLGWTQLPNTQLSTVKPSYLDILGSTNDQGFPSWSSGAMDTRRSRLLFHGGGHTDYFGNELYAIDLTGTPTPFLIKDASHGSALANLNNIPAPEAYSDGAPSARHTYSGYHYLPTQDMYWLFGAFRSKNGDSTNVTWLFNPRTSNTSGSGGWTQLPNTGPNNASNGSVPLYAYDAKTDTIFGIEDNVPNFWQWSPATQTWTLLNGSAHACPSTSSSTAAIDVGRRLFFCVGVGNSGPNFWSVSLNSPFTETNLGTPAGCGLLTSTNGPGFAYDPINLDMVGWVGGNNVIIYNPDTNACTTLSSFTGGPGAAQSAGTFNKWQYDPHSGGFVVDPDASSNTFFFRRTDQVTAANADWGHRSTAAGVVAAQTFDSAGLYVAVNHGFGCYPSIATNPVSAHPLCEQDTSIFRSGTASMRFVAQAKSEDRPNGFLAQYFGVEFQQNSDVYIQIAQRMDAGYLLPMPAVGGGPATYLKNFIFTHSNLNTGGSNLNSCGQPSMVVVNANNNGYAVQYLDCGVPTLDMPCPNSTTCDEYDQNFINGTTTGAQGYTCIHGTAQPSPNCFDYPVNTWVAWYYHIHIGTWGVANSLFESWVSTPNSPSYRQWLYRPNQVFANDGGGTPLSFNTAQLLSYWTNRDGTVCAPGCVDGTQWYDEFIVSTQPIMYPQAPPAVP